MDCCEKGEDDKMRCKMMGYGNMDHGAMNHAGLDHSAHTAPQPR